MMPNAARQFEVGAKVLIDTKNIRLLARAKDKDTRRVKLLPRYMGPFKIKKRISDMAYQVELPPHLKIHDVLSISLLHPYLDSGRVQPPPPPIDIGSDWEYEVEEILNERTVRRNGRNAPNFENQNQ